MIKLRFFVLLQITFVSSLTMYIIMFQKTLNHWALLSSIVPGLCFRLPGESEIAKCLFESGCSWW